ncbi:hypothetical protein NUU61_005977 [Penicillium alfredii]|uniref:Uncharacterized protein n=1 Tax=Penicillium alfredii TaxID=1506179 RepID=A0A9W9F042_9EURO|nr:uncharacterized protein NUU61_005977 [Penicillium alfredii]KAJ5091107.1 hypothetical protein NUU61_005977 [Penicillium alfredii]
MSINPFFKGFPGFDHDPTAGVCAEFQRISQHRKWKQGSKKWRKNWDACITAEYDRLIGIRVTSLATWQQICKKLGLKGLFTSITKCKKALCRVHVNLVDLLDCWEGEQGPQIFRTLSALRNYTKRTNRFFNKKAAKQDPVLRILLRELL